MSNEDGLSRELVPPAPLWRRAKARYSLRFLFLLITLVAIGFGVYTQLERPRRAVAEIRARGGDCYFRPIRHSPRGIEAWARANFPRSYFDPVHSVELTSAEITNEDLAHVASLSSVQRLTLRSENIRQKGIERLTSLTSLRAISFWPTPSLGVFKSVADLRTLQEVHVSSRNDFLLLSKPTLSDDSLGELAKLPRLRSISIEGDSISDKGWAAIGQMASLEDLHVGSGKISETGLAHLSSLPSLQSLALWQMNIDPSGLKHLSKLEKLRAVSLMDSTLSDQGLVELSNQPALERLSLAQTGVTDQGLSSVAKMSSLRSLNLSRTSISNAGLRQLAGLRLEHLELSETQISDEELSTLKHFAQLEFLNLHRTNISHVAYKDLQATLPKCKIVPPYDFEDEHRNPGER